VSEPLLTVTDLSLDIVVDRVTVPILERVSFTIAAGEAFGLVGESGSGKSMTARSITRLLPQTASLRGEITLDGRSLMSLPSKQLREVRAHDVQMIFQDPRAHINPVRKISDFLTEGLRTNTGLEASAAQKLVVEILESIGVPNARARLAQYPHELSGGLLQRMMIASALAAEPRLLIADEPTTALDVTTQADVMALIDGLRRNKNLALLFITHDLELASAICDRTGVMYAGTLVEIQSSSSLHEHPLHPYTAALLASRPSVTSRARLMTIRGSATSLAESPAGCPFAPRCAHSQQICLEQRPTMSHFDRGDAACLRVKEIGAALTQAARDNR
jgi:oligopeptide/dipeptide ABC transporter ATP-binding protein